MYGKRYTSLFAAVLALDIITKALAQSHLSFTKGITIIPHVFSLQLVHNYGAAYGILQNQRIFLTSISIAVLIGIYFLRHKIGTSGIAKIGLCFLMAGTAGNLIDRVFRGFVVDFANIYIVPVFNIADVAIDIGIVALLIDLIINREPTTTQNKQHPA